MVSYTRYYTMVLYHYKKLYTILWLLYNRQVRPRIAANGLILAPPTDCANSLIQAILCSSFWCSFVSMGTISSLILANLTSKAMRSRATASTRPSNRRNTGYKVLQVATIAQCWQHRWCWRGTPRWGRILQCLWWLHWRIWLPWHLWRHRRHCWRGSRQQGDGGRK